MIEISSASNSKFKYFKSLLDKKGRSKVGEYIVEGIKSVNDAAEAGCEITAIIATEKQKENIPENTTADIYIIADFLMEKLSDTKSPQGIAAVIRRGSRMLPDISKEGLYIYCDNVSDPGNLGTIIRTADSAGFNGVLLSSGCVDVYNPKTIRSCMGSFFHIPVYDNVAYEFLEEYSKQGKVYGGILTGNTVDYREPSYDNKTIIVVGNEANGISDRVKKICIPVKIPIYGKAESLNAAVAAALLMYEAADKIYK